MNGIEYDICDTQGRIYEFAAAMGYECEKFSDAYLRSDFCRRAMDSEYSRFQLEDEQECWDFIFPEIKDALTRYAEGSEFDGAAAYWIGFTYRQSAIVTGLSSEELSLCITFSAMCRYYPGLHTIDEDEAMNIIIGNINSQRAFI